MGPQDRAAVDTVLAALAGFRGNTEDVFKMV